MKVSTCLAAILCFVLVLNSCEYNDDSSHFVNPEAGAPPVFTVQCNLDTFSILETGDQILVSYEAEIENGILYLVTGEINEEMSAYDTVPNLEADSESGPLMLRDSFYLIRDVDLLPGDNLFELRFYYSTNTNTLADHYGVESNLSELSYLIHLMEEPK